MKWKEIFPLPIVAALIIGMASIFGVLIAIDSSKQELIKTLEAQEQRDKTRRDEEIQGVLHAIYEELYVVNEILTSDDMISSWTLFEKEKTFFRRMMGFSQDYLLIYNSNAHIIGQIKNLELRRQIVWTYMMLRLCLETYLHNDEFLIRIMEARGNEKPEVIHQVDHLLRITTPPLKELHDLSVRHIKELLGMLERELTLPNNQGSRSCQ